MKIKSLLESISGKCVSVLINNGNRGDGIIHMGARTLFNQYGIKQREINWSYMYNVQGNTISGDILLVHGCGSFCIPYHESVVQVDYYKDRFDRIIILPSSFDIRCEPVSKFISNLQPHIHVFCRERYSYNQVLSLAPHKSNIYIDHDLSLYLDYRNWKSEGRGTLIAFRTNNSNTEWGFQAKKRFYNISAQLLRSRDCMDVSHGNALEGEKLLSIITQYRKVITDRAHVAIAAAYLGKETRIFPGSYHKVKGIYEFSLAHLSNVAWKG